MSAIRYKFVTWLYSRLRVLRISLFPRKLLSPSEKYFKSGGNDLLVDLNLTKNSFCIDFGGYKGVWTNEIALKFNSNIWVYEPVTQFADYLKEKFQGNPKITVHSYGISRENSDMYLSVDGARSGQHIDKEHKILATFKDSSELLRFSIIDVVKINIEGGEYELIPELLEKNLWPRIQTVLIQFHQTANQDIDNCKNILSLTHKPTWVYELVWERWDRTH